jgi:hypothetical protein
MSNKNKGAFASKCTNKFNNVSTQKGLTKREYIAIMIMQGLRASGIKHESTTGNKTYYYPESSKKVAEMAINDADELLKQLESTPPNSLTD